MLLDIASPLLKYLDENVHLVRRLLHPSFSEENLNASAKNAL
jgi:hypothetical protein